MPVHNSDIANFFNELADILEIEGANEFRVRAYRNAARVVGDLPHSLSAMVERGEKLSQLPGIGKDLAGKIEEIVKTGSLLQLKQEEGRLPGLRQLMKVGGLGPKRVKILHDQLGVVTVDDLRRAALDGRINSLRGFGSKTEKAIIDEDR